MPDEDSQIENQDVRLPAEASFPRYVSRSKCEELLEAHSESDVLDYKKKIAIPSTEAYLDLVKDVAGMSVKGGYILIGVDNDGDLWLDDTEVNERLWDESNIRQQLAKYLPEGVEVNIAIHDFTSRKLVLVHVHPHKDGFVIMKSDGQYSDERNGQNTKFSKGDIFIRHGTSTEKIAQLDIHLIFEKRIEVAREVWREEIFSLMGNSQPVREILPTDSAQRQMGLGGSSTIRTELSWILPLAAFRSVALEAVRNSKFDDLEILFHEISRIAENSLVQESPELSLSDILDRVTIVSALAVIVNNQTAFELSIEALGKVYLRGLDGNGVKRSNTILKAQVVWLEVLKRVYAIGGLIVRKKRWKLLRMLVLQGPVVGEMSWYENWISHGVTEAARANLFYRSEHDGTTREVRLLVMAQEEALGAADLSIDTAAGSDELLDSICQFDVLSCLVFSVSQGLAGDKYLYPNSAEFYPERSQPALDRVVGDSSMRSELGLEDDVELRRVLNSVLDLFDRVAGQRRIFPRQRSGSYLNWLNS